MDEEHGKGSYDRNKGDAHPAEDAGKAPDTEMPAADVTALVDKAKADAVEAETPGTDPKPSDVEPD